LAENASTRRHRIKQERRVAAEKWAMRGR